jgi:hypothetical protein
MPCNAQNTQIDRFFISPPLWLPPGNTNFKGNAESQCNNIWWGALWVHSYGGQYVMFSCFPRETKGTNEYIMGRIACRLTFVEMLVYVTWFNHDSIFLMLEAFWLSTNNLKKILLTRSWQPLNPTPLGSQISGACPNVNI